MRISAAAAAAAVKLPMKQLAVRLNGNASKDSTDGDCSSSEASLLSHPPIQVFS